MIIDTATSAVVLTKDVVVVAAAGAAVIIQLIQRRQPPPSERRSKGGKKTRFRRWRRAVNFYLDCNMSVAKRNDEFFFLFNVFFPANPSDTGTHTHTHTHTNAYIARRVCVSYLPPYSRFLTSLTIQ